MDAHKRRTDGATAWKVDGVGEATAIMKAAERERCGTIRAQSPSRTIDSDIDGQ